MVFLCGVKMKTVDYEKITAEITELITFRSVFTPEECKEISHAILEYKADPISNNEKEFQEDSNAFCWRGSPMHFGSFSPELKEKIVETINQSFYFFINGMPISDEKKQTLIAKNRLIEIWANVNDQKSYNTIHSHTVAIMSGCLYLQCEGTGDIEFIPVNTLLRQTHVDWPFHKTYCLTPKEGDLMVFPSYLLHQVKTNFSEKQRINIAFNVTFKD